MRTSKILLGTGTLLLAVVSAFATSKAQRVNTYYYQSATGGCKPVVIEFGCQIGGIGCVIIAGTGTQPKQLFKTQLNAALCRSTLKDV